MGADVSTNAKEGCNCLTLCVPQQSKGGVGHGNVHPAGGGPPRRTRLAGGADTLAARKDELSTQCDELGDQIMHAERELALFKESSTRMIKGCKGEKEMEDLQQSEEWTELQRGLDDARVLIPELERKRKKAMEELAHLTSSGDHHQHVQHGHIRHVQTAHQHRNRSPSPHRRFSLALLPPFTLRLSLPLSVCPFCFHLGSRTSALTPM
eukprot:Tamp_17230.p1 GENE.Tamp_17230~~Tamp_17230.p1  ORF type:complete len:209 (-),score=14.80 Tamp_17230:639-1265(-)